MKGSILTFLFLCVSGTVAFISFSVIGPYNSIDSADYIAQVEQFESGTLLLEPHKVALRAFKPLYGVVGAFFGPLLSPWEALQLFNLVLLFALPFVSFAFLRELGFRKEQSVWGAIWITAGYPVLKYGLAVSTDIGGWFFTLLTAYLVLVGIRTGAIRILLLASLVGFIGGTAKETGVLGLLFGGLYILFTSKTRTLARTLKYLVALALPALLLEIVLFGILILAGLPTFFNWYGVVMHESFIEEHFKLSRLVGVLSSTFSTLLLFGLFGVWAIVKKRVLEVEHVYAKAVALFLASLPVLLWTEFISRILYIQFLIVVPLALWGVTEILRFVPKYREAKIKYVFYLLPIATSLLLFVIAGKNSLFDIFF